MSQSDMWAEQPAKSDLSEQFDQFLDDYWQDIKKAEELITTIQARYKRRLADMYLNGLKEQ